MALLLSPAAAVVAGCLGATLAFLRTSAVLPDSAIREGDLKIGSSSPAQECTCIERWARRLAAMPWRFTRRLADIARAKPSSGELTRLRALPIALIVNSLLIFIFIGGALAVENNAKDSVAESPPIAEAGSEPAAEPPLKKDTERDEEKTYADLCPALPDPLVIGHGLGQAFRHDGGFKAGCGTPARQVRETGAWFSAGICDGQLRSVAITSSPTGRDAVLLYGAAARFAWRSALREELVSAEAAHPAEGDVFLVEILAGTYGFARTAPSGGWGSSKVHTCTEVTATGRPFAELYPPMLLQWRNLLERRASWSWPLREGPTGAALVFAAYPSGTVTARGTCPSDFYCYMYVGGARWSGEGTAYVSLDELSPYMPPSDP
ncbi:MAG TPA: hypothetical protein VFP23_09950 [Solirubrobacterales bacterium]|nr:hypothetical protein [Solirubrobacterales bacterium]